MALNQLPDFSFKGGVDPSIVQAYQRKAEAENQMRIQAEQQKQAKIAQVAQVFQSGAQITSALVQHAQAKQHALAQQAVSNKLLEGNDQVPTGQMMYSGQADRTPGPLPANQMQVPVMGNRSQYDPAWKTEFASTLAKADPEIFNKYASEQVMQNMFPEPKAAEAQSYSPQKVTINGVPAQASFNSKTNQYSVKGQPVPQDADIQPYDPSEVTDLTDKDRKIFTPLAKKLIEGTATASDLTNFRGSARTKLAQVATELDPNFDLGMAKQRSTMRTQYTPAGLPGKNIIAMNTAIGHAASLKEAVAALDPQQFKLYNKVKNRGLEEVGDPKVRRVMVLRNAVADETAKVYQGQGVLAQQAKNEVRDGFDMASSKEQWNASLDATIELMSSRLTELKYGWSGTMGENTPPMPFINPKNQKLLDKMGYNPEDLSKRSSNNSGLQVPDGWSVSYGH